MDDFTLFEVLGDTISVVILRVFYIVILSTVHCYWLTLEQTNFDLLSHITVIEDVIAQHTVNSIWNVIIRSN
jgi:hypothetical protein